MSTLASLKNLVGTGELLERETRHASGVAQWGLTVLTGVTAQNLLIQRALIPHTLI
jgi:hypothetical protein